MEVEVRLWNDNPRYGWCAFVYFEEFSSPPPLGRKFQLFAHLLGRAEEVRIGRENGEMIIRARVGEDVGKCLKLLCRMRGRFPERLLRELLGLEKPEEIHKRLLAFHAARQFWGIA